MAAVEVSAPPTPTYPPCDGDDEDYEDDQSTDADDDAGSLVDFIVDDESQKDGSEDDASVRSASPVNASEAIKRELDDIDASNILSGKRTRRQTKFYANEALSDAEYRAMMLQDVPPEEEDAIYESSEEEEHTEDEAYETDEEGDSEGEGEDGDSEGALTGDEDSKPAPTPESAQ
jgi:hypothetical protein